MAKIRNFVVGNLYHLYSRGVEKRIIFIEDSDYRRFMKSIFFFNSDKSKNFDDNCTRAENPLVFIEEFVLMPNHFHILLKELVEGGASKFMQKLLTSYSMYFNKKYNRSGALFGSRFLDKLVNSDPYYEHLKNYIKYNPVKIIRPSYYSKDLLEGNITLTKKEVEFIESYPYFYSI